MEEVEDIGITYSEMYGKSLNKFISFASQCSNGDLIIIEQSIKVSRIRFDRYLNCNSIEEIHCPFEKIVACVEDEKGYIYFLTKSPNQIVRLNFDGSFETIFHIPLGYEPIHLSASRWAILLTCIPAKLIIINNTILTIDLMKMGFMEPMWVDQTDNNKFLITDSLLHTVEEIDQTGEVLWKYGQRSNPGEKEGELYIPMSSIMLKNGNVLIAEQRSHRVIEITRDGHIVNQYGLCGLVGLTGRRMWAPNMAFISKNGEYIISVLSKSGSIIKINKEDKVISNIYGDSLIIKSDLNFQRSCEWSDLTNELLVSDTGHNRIVCFDKKGKVTLEISKVFGEKLYWPRCSTWIGREILITDSRNRRILLVNRRGDVKKCWSWKDSYDIFEADEWLQISMLNSDKTKLLVASENMVVLFETATKNVVWSSKNCKLDLKDIHCAEITHEGTIIITDTGNNRGVFIDKYNNISILDYVLDNDKKVYFNLPRMIKQIDNKLIIVDSGNSKVYEIKDVENPEVIRSYGDSRGLSPKCLSAPRWACIGINKKYLFISDTDNHRIVSIKYYQ